MESWRVDVAMAIGDWVEIDHREKNAELGSPT
jgi:hypothetical protein